MKANISFGLLLLVATLKVWAAEAPTATTLGTCVACHGEQGQGNAALGAPNLAGQHSVYLAQQMRGFKTGSRGYDPKDTYGAQMRAIVANLDEAEIDRLAMHYARLEPPRSQVVVGEQAARGRDIYQGTCASCHGPEGEGFAYLKAPNLRILDASYLDRQLVNYVQGVRGSGGHADQLGLWMRGISLQISGDADRKAIIDYIVSLSANGNASKN
jgi:cytochrome c oxidase subunit 2